MYIRLSLWKLVVLQTPKVPLAVFGYSSMAELGESTMASDLTFELRNWKCLHDSLRGLTLYLHFLPKHQWLFLVEQQGAKHQEDETPRSSGHELIVAEIADSAHAPQQLHESLYAHNHEQQNRQYSNSLWQNLVTSCECLLLWQLP